jgi:hypothetical protein
MSHSEATFHALDDEPSTSPVRDTRKVRCSSSITGPLFAIIVIVLSSFLAGPTRSQGMEVIELDELYDMRKIDLTLGTRELEASNASEAADFLASTRACFDLGRLQGTSAQADRDYRECSAKIAARVQANQEYSDCVGSRKKAGLEWVKYCLIQMDETLRRIPPTSRERAKADAEREYQACVDDRQKTGAEWVMFCWRKYKQVPQQSAN